jgi:ankyrin repeat protein
MARKKAAKQQQSSVLVPHRTPDLSSLLERAKQGREQDVKAYLDAGGSATALVQLRMPDNQLITVQLLFAVLKSHSNQKEVAASIELLIAAGAQPNATAVDWDGHTQRSALVWAMFCSCCTLPLQTLLGLGADPCRITAADAQVALHTGALRGTHFTKMKMLIDADPEHRVDLRDAGGTTPLLHAAGKGHYSLVVALHRAGADPDGTDCGGRTPLGIAVNEGHIQVAEYLIYSGAKVNKRDDLGTPPLYYAAHSGKTAAVQVLLDHGADTSIINNDGSTAMHMAAVYGYVDIMKQLQQHGLDINQSRNDGVNVLMLAAQ